MSSTFFTTTDGDIILRAGPKPYSKHDFRVHKFILSLASPVFKDMFAFPQPPDQILDEEHQLPIVDILDPSDILDTILRLIYPGVEPPSITVLSTLHALFSTADKYNIASICPVLREQLKVLLPDNPLTAYIIARQFGFLQEAREAAKVLAPANFVFNSPPEALQYISTTDLYRLFQFLERREHFGIHMIQDALGSEYLDFVKCTHGVGGKEYYFRLQKAVEGEFAMDPSVGPKDLLTVLDKIPDPPPGCKAPPMSADWYLEGSNEDAFHCPLQPMTIRKNLADLAEALAAHNIEELNQLFGKDGGS